MYTPHGNNFTSTKDNKCFTSIDTTKQLALGPAFRVSVRVSNLLSLKNPLLYHSSIINNYTPYVKQIKLESLDIYDFLLYFVTFWQILNIYYRLKIYNLLLHLPSPPLDEDRFHLHCPVHEYHICICPDKYAPL